MGRKIGDFTKPHLRQKFMVKSMGEEPVLQHMVRGKKGTVDEFENKRKAASSENKRERP